MSSAAPLPPLPNRPLALSVDNPLNGSAQALQSTAKKAIKTGAPPILTPVETPKQSRWQWIRSTVYNAAAKVHSVTCDFFKSAWREVKSLFHGPYTTGKVLKISGAVLIAIPIIAAIGAAICYRSVAFVSGTLVAGTFGAFAGLTAGGACLFSFGSRLQQKEQVMEDLNESAEKISLASQAAEAALTRSAAHISDQKNILAQNQKATYGLEKLREAFGISVEHLSEVQENSQRFMEFVCARAIEQYREIKQELEEYARTRSHEVVVRARVEEVAQMLSQALPIMHARNLAIQTENHRLIEIQSELIGSIDLPRQQSPIQSPEAQSLCREIVVRHGDVATVMGQYNSDYEAIRQLHEYLALVARCSAEEFPTVQGRISEIGQLLTSTDSVLPAITSNLAETEELAERAASIVIPTARSSKSQQLLQSMQSFVTSFQRKQGPA